MAPSIEPPWRSVNGPSSPKNVHCLSGGIVNADKKRQNIGKPLSPPRSSSPHAPSAIDGDSDSSDGSIPDTPPRVTSSDTTGPNVGLNQSKCRPDNSATSLLSPVPLSNRGVTEGPKEQIRKLQGIENRHQHNWNGTHDSHHGVLAKSYSPQHAEKSKEHDIIGNELTRIRLPSLDIPSNSTSSNNQVMGHNDYYLDRSSSFGPRSSSTPDSVRRASSASEGMRWSSSSPTSMPPPPLPLQVCATHVESLPRALERAPGVPRPNPLSVSELIHRESTGSAPTPTPATNGSTGTSDQVPSLANDLMDILKLRERVSDADRPAFFEELNHQLSLTGLLREAREVICGTFDLTERQREIFIQQSMGMLTMDKPAREMREVISRAVVGMSPRDMADFAWEVVHMLNGSVQKSTSPDREAISCAAHAAKFPEDQQSELIRQLKNMPPAAFQPRQPHTVAKGNTQSPGRSLPPLREWEKLADLRRAGTAGAKGQQDPIKPRPNYSLREFPIFPSH